MSWLKQCWDLVLVPSELSMLRSFVDSLKIRGLLPFSGVTRTVEETVSMSVHLSFRASPALAPVSLRSWRSDSEAQFNS